MAWVLRIPAQIVSKDGRDVHVPHSYLASADIEANGPAYPTGNLMFEEDINKAMIFGNPDTAFDFYSTQSKTCPFRPDGKPNRPLMALTMDVVGGVGLWLEEIEEMCNATRDNGMDRVH